MKPRKDSADKGAGSGCMARLVRFFRFCFGCGFILGGDPARQFHWVNRLLQRVNGCDAMPPIEYLEAVRRAKKDYRAWYLCVFLDVGDGGVKPPFRVGWNHDSWVEIVRVKQHHLLYHYASSVLEKAHIERNDPAVPLKALDRQQWDVEKVTLPILVAKVCDLLIRPSGLQHAMANPKIKRLIRHVWKHRLGSVNVSHGVVLNSLANSGISVMRYRFGLIFSRGFWAMMRLEGFWGKGFLNSIRLG